LLRSLPKLTAVSLQNLGIYDISPLSQLNLSWLDVSDNAINDVSPLMWLDTLRWLDIANNPIHDVSKLAVLNKLHSLYMGGNAITDLSQVYTLLKGLPDLSTVRLDNLGISDVSPLASLTGLRSLKLNDNAVSDLSPLIKLDGLDDLELKRNPIDCAQQKTTLQAIRKNGTRIVSDCP
jgi:internalin A